MAVTKCEEICLAVKKGARRRWRVLCKPEKEEVTGGLRGGLVGVRGAKVQNTNHWMEVGAASAASSNQPSLGAGSSENSIYCFSNYVFQKEVDMSWKIPQMAKRFNFYFKWRFLLNFS